MNRIRSSVKALIIHDHHVLTIKKGNEYEAKYVIPGGGQDFNESLSDAVIRECLEELGVKVEVGPLLWIREFISKNHVVNQKEEDRIHIVEHIFEAFLEKVPSRFQPLSPDSTQLAIKWLPIDRLLEYNYYPHEIIPLIQEKSFSKYNGPTYVGDIN
ncbi:NUDIX domain-containing protein [Fictibacillus sp. 26RED30]|uniref:NUDIX domain-containing protein n=1 Tax=Fictibacillus sp. 26RED30 TaxID=2745877 RepID=UPI0018CD2EF5|nr:NUDIX domain-containing protein [Fictibacillus sp. 26RED30]MBH0163241.1 NUDIX domain-containing protein [Fictibacillus sp. 26RED30]